MIILGALCLCISRGGAFGEKEGKTKVMQGGNQQWVKRMWLKDVDKAFRDEKRKKREGVPRRKAHPLLHLRGNGIDWPTIQKILRNAQQRIFDEYIKTGQGGCKLETIDARSPVDQKTFNDLYLGPRKPVLITNHIAPRSLEW